MKEIAELSNVPLQQFLELSIKMADFLRKLKKEFVV